jgi:hypothetical protein
MTTTYQKLLNKIEAFCNAHLQIKKYKGEFKEQMPNFATLDEKYPIVFVVPNGDTEGLELNQFTLEVYCLDIIQKDRANINTIVSDCHLILKDLYLYFKDGTDLEVDVIGDPTMTPLNNDLLDYAAGWVMTITFEVEGYTVCAIPMNPIPPFTPICEDASYLVEYVNGTPIESGTIPSGGSATIQVPDPSVCDDATVENSDLSYTATVASGDTLVLPDITVTDSDGSTFTQPAVTNVVCTFNPPCDDAIVNINSVFWDNVPSGGTENIIVRQSSGSTQVGSIQGQYFRIADSTAVVKNSVNTVISTTLIKAEDSEDIILPDETITITDELGNPLDVITFPVYSTLNIDIDSYCTPCPPAVTRSTATLMKTGQTTSYRTGDDGDLEVGRDTDFFTLAENNPFGNTNRFTDELGGQTYTNDIVIDWSTYNGANVLGYNRNINYWAGSNWNTAIDNALLYSIGTYTSGWYLANKKQHENLQNINIVGQALNYAPFNYTTTASLWTSTTDPDTTTSAYRWNLVQKTLTALIKTAGSNMRTLAVRTFTVTGTTLT